MSGYRSSILTLIFPLSLCALMFNVGCSSSSTGPTGIGSVGTLSGVVTDSVTQKPIGQATIQIAGRLSALLSDSLGNFKLDNLAVGAYLVTISKSGYVSHSDSVKIVKGAIATLSRALAPSGAGNTGGWTRITTGITQNINSVTYAGGGYFFAVGDDGIVFRSTDGGVTWTALPSSGGPQADVVFSDKLHGFTANLYGVSVTIDGGNTWTTKGINQDNNAEYRAVAVSGNVVYAAGDFRDGSGVVTMSSDGGIYWHDVLSPLTHPTEREYGLAMASPTYICVVGSYCYAGVSTFDGSYWTQTRVTTSLATLYSVAMPNLKDIFAVGDSGLIFHSIDSGFHWIQQTSGVGKALRHVAFYDGKTGLAVGDSGTVILTKDGGTSWQNISIPGNTFTGCAFQDATHAVIVGANGAIYRSTF
jgi:photosystem II stability/assembly factor-like uncharacterized protein